MGELKMKKCTDKMVITSSTNKEDTTTIIRDSNSTNVTILKSRDIFIKSLVANEYSENTLKNYEGDFNFFHDFIKTKLHYKVIYLTDINYQHLEFYKKFLIERNTYSTACRKFNCLRTYFKTLYRKGLIPSNIIDSLKEDDFGINQKGKLENLDEIRKQILSKETIDEIYKRIKNDKGKNMKRNLTLFKILFMGLSRSEVLSLKWEDINFEDKTISICRPQNNTPIIVALPDSAFDALIKYYKSCMCKKELKTKVFNISTTPYNKIIKKYTVGLQTETGDTNIVGHCARHSAVVHMIRANVPLTEIQKVVGISLDKLQVYTHLSLDDTVKAASEIYTSMSA